MAERSQVAIPREIRGRYGFGPAVEVEIVEEDGRVVIRKKQLWESPAVLDRSCPGAGVSHGS